MSILPSTVQDLRKIHVGDSQVGVIGDNATVHGGINFIKKVVTSPWAVGLLALGVMLLGVIALANLPGAREQLPRWLQPRAFPKEREDEVLIVIAQFHTTEGVVDTAAHDEIKCAIEQKAGDLNLRVEVAPTILEAGDREGAQALGDRYDASLVIWGADTGVRVSVNFYNREQPDFQAADVRIEETARTQIAAPSEYAEFVTQDLPRQLTFLALFAVGQSYYAEKACAESARVIEQAIAALEQQPEIIEGAVEAYFHLGWLSYGLHSPIDDLDGAHAAYTRALELDPEYAAAYVNQGITYAEMGKYERALADFNRALELDPDFAKAYNNRGLTYAEMGDDEQALADFNRALNMDPDCALTYFNRGNSYHNMGEYEQALADYTQALELDPEDATTYNNRGITYDDMSDYEQALADYTQALELDPELAEAYGNRGTTYLRMGKYEQALADYTQVLELDPDLAAAYSNRGNTYHEMGEYEQALADYKRAVELWVDPSTYYFGAITHAQLGHGVEACAWLEAALKLVPAAHTQARTDPGFGPIRDEPCFQTLMNDSE